MGKILILEDDPDMRPKMVDLFCSSQHKIFDAGNIAEADCILDKHCIDVVLLDIELNGTMSGIDYISHVHGKNPNTQIIMVTIYNDIERIIEATKKGAFYYLTKPFDPQEILLLTEKALIMSKKEKKVYQLEQENTLLIQRLKLSESTKKCPIIGISPKIVEVQKQIKWLNQQGADSSILLYGESGVGKEVFARFINQTVSEINDDEVPFIAVNCTSIPEHLFESEFFGHEKGAFTGASKTKHGYFEIAQSGHVFLDEIGDMPMDFQVKLLRVLQEKQIRRIGGIKDIACDFRLITATNKNLKQRVKEGRFREDLFYRIATIDIEIPPLRERPEDIPLLIDHFLNEINRKSKLTYPSLEEEILNLMRRYQWPGNVRELKSTIEKLVFLGFDGESYQTNTLPESIINRTKTINGGTGRNRPEVSNIEKKMAVFMADIQSKTNIDYKGFMGSLEREILKEVMSSCNNSGLKAAKRLGLSKSVFYSRLKLSD